MFNRINSEAFGEYLKCLRKKLKITQTTITELTGINPDTIRKIECGQVIPRYDTLAALSCIYKIDLVRKFAEFQTEPTLISLYSNVDQFILNDDVIGVQAVIEHLEHKEFYHQLSSNLINKVELQQFILYLEILSDCMRNKNFIPYAYLIGTLEHVIRLTIPNFNASTFPKFNYNSLEIRLLLLYAVLLHSSGKYAQSNKMLYFVLDYLSFLFPNEQTAIRYNIKVHDYIAQNYLKLNLPEKSLAHVEKGIEIGQKYFIYNDLHSLYFTKFSSELMLNKPYFLNSLQKCIAITELTGSKNLLAHYKQMTKSLYDYNFDHNADAD